MDRLARLLKLRPGEGPLVSLLALQYFFVVAVTIAGKSTRDTYFLSRFDRSYLPLMFVACAIAVALLASGFSRAAARHDRQRLSDVSYVAFIAVLLALNARMTGFAVPALYVWMEVVISLATLQFWLQAADFFDPRQAKRLIGLIGGGGSLAAFLTGMSLRPFVHAFGSDALLLLVCVGLGASWLCGRLASRRSTPAHHSHGRTSRSAPAAKLDQYLISIALIVGLSAAVTQVVDYQFKISAATSIADERGLASFFGRFYALTGAASLLMQLLVTPLMLGRFGLRAGLLTLPACLGASAVAFAIRPGLLTASLGKFADQSVKFTLNNSSLELLWLPVSPERRRVLKPLVGGTLKASAEAMAGLVTFFAVKQVNSQLLSGFVMAAVALWIAGSARIVSRYIRELGLAIERREVDMTDLEIDVQDSSFTQTIDRELKNPDVLRRLFALELMEGLPLGPWVPRLRQMLLDGTPDEQDRILELARHERKILPDTAVVELVEEGGRFAGRAIEVAASRSLADCLPGLHRLLREGDDLTRARAASAIRRISGAGEPAATAEVARLARESTGEAQAVALVELWADQANLTPGLLREVLANGAVEGRAAAAAVAALRGDAGLIPGLLALLSDGRTAPAGEAALASMPAEAVTDAIRTLLGADPASPHRAGVLRSIANLPLSDPAPLVTDVLDRLSGLELRAAAQTLLSLMRRSALSESLLPRIEDCVRRLTREPYRCARILYLLGEDRQAMLVADHYHNRTREAVPGLLMLGSITRADSPVEQFVRVYESADAARLPFVLEFIDSSFRPDDRARLVPLLERGSWEEKNTAGARLYPDLPETLESALREAAQSPDDWESAVVRHYIGKTGRALPAPVEDLEESMYSALEKTILLKSVSLFQNIPAEVLSKIASIAVERRASKGELILREGDFGESLFVVAGGSVRIHLGEQELAVLGRGDCLGEMAVLDGAPRSASATALEDTTLLEIDQPNFYQVMESYSAVMHGVVRLLTRRLREDNERLARMK